MNPEAKFSQLAAEVTLAECGLTRERVVAMTRHLVPPPKMRQIIDRYMVRPTAKRRRRPRVGVFKAKKSKHMAKYEAILAEIDGHSNITDLCRKHDADPVLFRRWRKRREEARRQ